MGKILTATVTLAAALGMTLAGPAAHAAVAYNQTIPAVYGTGNPSTGWTADNELSGVQLGLDTILRYVGGVTPNGGNTSVYTVPLGGAPSPHTGPAWDYVFSTHGLPSGATSAMTITDVRTGTTSTFDPLSIPDNTTGAYIQNAEALSFPLVGLPGFNQNLDDTYSFLWTAYDSTNTALGSVGMTVVAGGGAPVPEPSTLAMFGFGVFVLAFLCTRGRNGQHNSFA